LGQRLRRERLNLFLEFDLIVCCRVQQCLHAVLLGFFQLGVRFQTFGQEEQQEVIFSRSHDPFQPLGVQFGFSALRLFSLLSFSYSPRK